MSGLKKWMQDSANILFDDSKNDLRSLPKAVRLQILLVLSFIWTTVFSLYVFSYTTFAFGWAGTYIAHVGLIFAVYMTFKQFHKAEEKSNSVFETKNSDYKIMSTHYGQEITAMVTKNNIIGVQFHPEKSHKFGIKFLEAFLENEEF